MHEGRLISFRGTVQGVGFRPWVYRIATSLHIAGTVSNDSAGVTVEAFAPQDALDEFVAALRRAPPPAARIDAMEVSPLPARPVAGFTIAASRGATERRVSIPPDLALCADCERELFDPADRRYGYPFINCTNCGPRFTIAQGVPYDRAATTMARFPLCPDCAREYDDPLDRRFHAQPNACAACGPRLELWRPGQEASPDMESGGSSRQILARAAQALQAGEIVAVKGLGGYHLACDATSSAAVRLLRERKRREERPFAVMVRTLDEARGLATLSESEERLLASIERPIVLAQRREPGPLAPEVAPDSPRVGLLLAYTPLHHLLLAAVLRPLVMTSANVSDEPIAYRDDDARQRLAGQADLFLLHDREIESRCDDSVAQVVRGAPMLLRRARGFVPRSIPLARPAAEPVLALGADLKNAVCVAAGDRAVFGPHVGDLGSPETWRSLDEGQARLLGFLGVRPGRLACDLHPDSIAAAYARELAQRLGLPPPVGVQHHHAHVAAVMAEHGLDAEGRGPVFGLAWDGTGWGPGGALWGGELLLATSGSFERLATFRPLQLAGGERAIREVWRIALAAVDDAFDGRPPLDRLPLFAQVPPAQLAAVRGLLRLGVASPLAHGAGRAFDAAGALGLARPRARHEGQVALAWNLLAGDAGGLVLPTHLDQTRTPWELDLRPLYRRLCEALIDGAPAPRLSAAFHDALVAAGAGMVRAAAAVHGRLPVVLSGGCFANARLAEGLCGALAGFEVHLPRETPPGDGGLALGQAVVAARLGPGWSEPASWVAPGRPQAGPS